MTDIAGNAAQETLQFTIDTPYREPTIVLIPPMILAMILMIILPGLTNRCLLSVMSIMMYHNIVVHLDGLD